jgi:hypothetical protein
MTKVLPPPYTFGVEIECFGVPAAVVAWAFEKAGLQVVNLHGPSAQDGWQDAREQRYNASQWVLGSDCTINGEHPIEIKSPILKGFQGIEDLGRVFRILKDLGSKTNASCGLHVHVGVAGPALESKYRLDAPTIIQVVKRWAKHEKTIELLVAEDRREGKNQYCHAASRLAHKLEQSVIDVPVYGPEKPPAHIMSMRRTHVEGAPGLTAELESWARYGYGQYRWTDGRYHETPEKLVATKMALLDLQRLSSHYDGVSLQPLVRFGTIEFRLHHGIIDATAVCAWVSFILNHVETTRRLVKGEAGAGRGRKPGLFAGMPAVYRTHLQKRIVAAQAPAPSVAPTF